VTENRKVPVLLNGQGDYIRDRKYPQPIDYHRSQTIKIPPGCFVMMVTQVEFDILKGGQRQMLADGKLILRG